MVTSFQLNAQQRRKSFGIEIFGGLSLIDPADLNMRPEMDLQYENLFRDNYYMYLVNTGIYEQATKLDGGEFKSINKAMPLGLRLRYYLSESLALSIGFSYIWQTQSSEFTNHFLLSRGGQTYQEKYIYSPYTLTVRGYIPSIGLHFNRKINNSIGTEAGITVGPMFSTCGLSFDYHREWMTADGMLLHEYKFYSLKENGSGFGIALEANIRLDVRLFKFINPYIQVGYAYRKAEDFSGRGYRRDEGDTYWWDDEWGMKVYQEYRSYGSIDTLIPSNEWTDYRPRARDFVLDLSGFQAVAGFLFRF
jgi:hypothetical protein